MNGQKQERRREFWLSLGAWLLYVIAVLAFLTLVSPRGRQLFQGRIDSPGGNNPVVLTVLNTNDTWGYLNACG